MDERRSSTYACWTCPHSFMDWIILLTFTAGYTYSPHMYAWHCHAYHMPAVPPCISMHSLSLLNSGCEKASVGTDRTPTIQVLPPLQHYHTNTYATSLHHTLYAFADGHCYLLHATPTAACPALPPPTQHTTMPTNCLPAHMPPAIYATFYLTEHAEREKSGNNTASLTFFKICCWRGWQTCTVPARAARMPPAVWLTRTRRALRARCLAVPLTAARWHLVTRHRYRLAGRALLCPAALRARRRGRRGCTTLLPYRPRRAMPQPAAPLRCRHRRFRPAAARDSLYAGRLPYLKHKCLAGVSHWCFFFCVPTTYFLRCL